jgi:hypothetical protein
VLRLSTDRGLTWSKPLDLLAPGLTAVHNWAMAQYGDQVAVAYLGHRTGPTWDGWITTAKGVRASLAAGRTPVLTSGQVNDPKRPLLYGDNVQGAGTFQLPAPLGNTVPFPPPFDIQVFGNDFIGATIAPDGTAWGSYTQDCGPSPDSAGCVAQQGQTRGWAGHLERAAVAVAPVPVSAPRAPAAQLPATGLGALPACGAALLLVLLVVRRRTGVRR